MAESPFTVALKARPVLVVMDTASLTAEFEWLQAAQADIRLVATTVDESLQPWVKQGFVTHVSTNFEASQLSEACWVIAAIADPHLKRAIQAAVHRYQRLIYWVPSKHQPPQASIGHLTACMPMLGKRVRALVHTLRCHSNHRIARWLNHPLRSLAKLINATNHQKAGASAASLPHGSATQQGSTPSSPYESYPPTQPALIGSVTLVGAGPGDSGLLTRKGWQALQQADVVLYDQLVSDDILDCIPAGVARRCTGKRAGCHSMPQTEINRLMIILAQRGHDIVRLKGGDPLIFGRGGEEMQALQQAGIRYQVVPGITAAIAAAAYAGIPLTHRHFAQSVTLMTGHREAAQSQDLPDWPLLARSQQTLVIYMAMQQAQHISTQLIEHGRSATTPIAIISEATRVQQQVKLGQLDELAALAATAARPALVLIGEVVTLHRELAWFHRSASPLTNTAPD